MAAVGALDDWSQWNGLSQLGVGRGHCLPLIGLQGTCVVLLEQLK